MKVQPGQVWKELDGRFSREVQVVAVTPSHVEIRGLKSGRLTRAKIERFSGKHGGYRLVTPAGSTAG